MRGWQFVPAGKSFRGGKAEGTAEIDDTKAGIEKFRCEISRHFVRRGQESSAGIAGGNRSRWKAV